MLIPDAGLIRPLPVAHVGHVITVFTNILLMFEKLIAHRLLDLCNLCSQIRYAINHIFDQGDYLLSIARVTTLLNSRSHSTELATVAQHSQSPKLKLAVEKACCRNGM